MRIAKTIAIVSILLLLAGCDLLTQVTSQESTVTLANDGQTIRLHIGQHFLLKLGEDYDWAITVGDQTIISRVMNIAVVRGAQGVYEAKRTGQTSLEAAGDPHCRQEQPPCGMPSRLFRVQILVQ